MTKIKHQSEKIHAMLSYTRNNKISDTFFLSLFLYFVYLQTNIILRFLRPRLTFRDKLCKRICMLFQCCY